MLLPGSAYSTRKGCIKSTEPTQTGEKMLHEDVTSTAKKISHEEN